MVEETENTTTEQTDQTEETKTEETKTEETKTEETKTEETGAGIIARVKAKILGERATAEEIGNDIPDEFTTAARKMNWSDEQTTEFASSYTDEQLKEMIPSLLGEDTAKADETSDKAVEKTEPETNEEKAEDSQEDERLTQALARIESLEKAQGVLDKQSAEEEQAGFVKGASELFDKMSEEFEVFGKTDDLPKFPDGRFIPTSPQMKARNEVFGMAQQLKEAGMPGDKALEVSLNAYKGANLVTETKRSVIKGLKKREQTLGGKRVSHDVTAAADMTGPEIVAEVKRRHGK